MSLFGGWNPMTGLAGFVGGGLGAVLDPGGAFNNALNDLWGKGLNSLIDLPGQPGLEQENQAYSVRAQQNVSRLNDIQTVFYGRQRRWPEIKSASWSEYVNDDQVLHMLLQIGTGHYSIEDLLVGATPASSFPGFSSALYLPGERIGAFHPNVYTAQEVTNIDLVGAALDAYELNETFVFGGVGTPRRIACADVFDDAYIGGPVSIIGSPSNDGVYTLVARSSDDWIEVDADLVSETAACQVIFPQFENDGEVVRANDVDVVFDAGMSKIGGPVDSLLVFAVGDRVTPNDGINEGTAFTVLARAEDGSGLIVSPPPDDETITVDLLLLRREAGGYYACGPNDVVNAIGIDFVHPQGLARFNEDGDPRNRDVKYEVLYQPVNASGVPTGPKQSLGITTITAAQRKAVRRTVPFAIDPPCRPFVWTARVNADSDGGDVIDQGQWGGLRGFVMPREGEDQAVYPDATILCVSVTASGVLSRGSDTKINCMAQAWLQTYDLGTQTWSAEQPTRSIVWAALDAMRGPHTAQQAAIPDSEINLAAYVAADAVFTAAGWTFDGSFDTETNFWEGLKAILRCGRAQPTYDWRTGVFGIYLDRPAAPVQMFGELNSRHTGASLGLRDVNQPTGVIVEYTDERSWQTKQIEVGDVTTRPQRTQMLGCIVRQMAWEDGNYQWAEILYRNRTASFDCALEAQLLEYGSPVLYQCRRRRWGQGAEIVDAAGSTLTVDPPPFWKPSVQHFVYLRAPDGTPGAKIDCERGTHDGELVLASPPDVDVITGAGVRTLIAFGCPGNEPVVVLVQGITWQGMREASISGVLEDARVHDDPGPAPPDPDGDEDAPPALAIDNLDVTAAGLVVSSTWDAAEDALLYEQDWRYEGALSWTPAMRGLALSAEFTVPAAGVVQIRARAYGPAGRIGDYSNFSLSVGVGGTLTVAISPLSISQTSVLSNVTAGPISAAALGGTPPYTYLWRQVSGDPVTIVSPTAPSTNVRATLLPGDGAYGEIVCDVTDAAAALVTSEEGHFALYRKTTGGFEP